MALTSATITAEDFATVPGVAEIHLNFLGVATGGGYKVPGIYVYPIAPFGAGFRIISVFWSRKTMSYLKFLAAAIPQGPLFLIPYGNM